jgi:hypothetical protein
VGVKGDDEREAAMLSTRLGQQLFCLKFQADFAYGGCVDFDLPVNEIWPSQALASIS